MYIYIYVNEHPYLYMGWNMALWIINHLLSVMRQQSDMGIQ